ncbi:MAG: START domain-containing protein [Chitinophagaceae bacterium]
MKRTIIGSTLLLLFCIQGIAQKDWELKLDKQNVKVYTKTQENSNLKAIKVSCELNTTLTRLTAVIFDVNAGTEWVYSTRLCSLIKQVSPSELYYYSEVNLPWPLSNRDFVAHLVAKQDPATRIVTILGPVAPDLVPEKKGIVRVTKSYGRWIITPKGKDLVHLEYMLETDPGGSIPAWLVNMFVTKGPYETFKKLKEQLNKPKYANSKLPFITE